MLASLIVTSLAVLIPSQSTELRTLELNETQFFQEEATKLDCLVDESATLNFQTLIEGTPSWTPCDQDIPNYAYTTDAIWLRLPISLRPRVGEPWYLEIGWPHLDRVEVFLPTPDGTYQTTELGQKVPLSRREIVHRHMVVALKHDLQSQMPVYIRVTSGNLILLPITIQPRAQFIAHEQIRQSFLSFFYGLMFAMLIYNALSWLKTREDIFADYALFLASYTLLTAAIDKMTMTYLWPDALLLLEIEVPLFVAFLTYTLIRLSKSFLEIPQRSPKLNRILDIHVGIAVFGALLMFVAPHRFGAILTIGNGFFATLPFTGLALRMAANREGAARQFIGAWGALILGIFLVIFRQANLIENSFWSQYGIHLGGTLGVLMLALGISDRINLLKEERTRALNSALKIQQNAAQTLQQEVERQTGEIREQAKREAENLREIMTHSERLALLGQLVSSVAHEMNNPIGSLRLNESIQKSTVSNLRLFLDELLKDVNDEDRESLSPLFENLETLEETIVTSNLAHQRLLDVSSALRNQSRRDNEKTAFSLAELVQETLLIAKVRLQDVELTQENLEGTIWARRSHIGQILTNLITNAADALEEHGVQDKQIHISVTSSEEDNTIEVTVQDNGPGVPHDIRESIFENFYTTKEAGKGTGLGLHIARELAREHEGELWVDGEEGQGACFHLRLPHLPDDYS